MRGGCSGAPAGDMATVGRVNLVTFVLTRISEDEQAARALKPPYALEGQLADHFGRWIPPRVLLESAAKRRIIELIESSEQRDDELDTSIVLRMFALPYQDHPDYRQAWGKP